MKKNIYGFILFILLLFPINVYAMTGGLKITCSPSSVKANEVVTCTITGTSDEAVSKIEAQVVYINENVSVTSLTKDDVWSTGSIGNNNVFNVSTENSTIKDNFTVGTLKLKIGINATEPIDVNVLIQNISFTDNNGNKVSEGLTGDSATFSIDGVNEPQGPTTEPTPTVKGLKSLNITNGELVSGFDKTKDSFVANLSNADVTSFAIEAIPENANDGIVCRNSHTAEVLDCSNIFYIQSGNNNDMLIEIVVGSGDTQETYKLSILKPVSKVPELASLTIGGKSVNLVSGKTKDYEVVLDNISNYLVSWTLVDSDDFHVTNLDNNPTTHSGEFLTLEVAPKDKSSGLSTAMYEIKVVLAGGKATEQPTQKPVTPNSNPQTGGTSAVIMAIILFLSLGASIYFYQRNMSSYN